MFRPESRAKSALHLMLLLCGFAAPALAAGTSIPGNQWTAIAAHGGPVQILGYDKSVYVGSRQAHCIWGGYHEMGGSEPQEAMACYSYTENRWFVLHNNGVWHNEHAGEGGHTWSMFAYMPDRDALVFQSNSGSNVPEKQTGFWWWYDVGGLNGQNHEFTPRMWMGAVASTAAMDYDPVHKKLVFFPDNTGVVELCDPATNACSKPTTTGAACPYTGDLDMAYNPDDGKFYVFGGGGNDVYTYDVGASLWTQLTPSCSGADCVGGKPPPRRGMGWAYSTKDKVFLMTQGINGSYGSGTPLNDTWIFNPSANSGSGAWTEQTAAAPYPNTYADVTFDRLTYDPVNNVFILMVLGGGGNFADGAWSFYAAQIWAYAYSPALPYGTVSNTYTPPAGSLNRVPPTAASQSFAFDPAVAASGNTLYAGWIESGAPFDQSNCGAGHHPYIQSTPNNGTWTGLPGGSMTTACLAIDPEPSNDPGATDDSKLRLAVVNGTLWEAHEKGGTAGSPPLDSAWAKSWTGSAWVGGSVGCMTPGCTQASFPNYPAALIANGATPVLALGEENHTVYDTERYIYVAQWNGSAWAPLGGMLNILGTGTKGLFAALATDGTHPAACWSEEQGDGSRAGLLVTPQIECAQWNGSAWARFGSTSLNRNPSSWAYAPAMTYMGGHFYIAWDERTTAGNSQLFACRWDGGSCTLLGAAPINITPSTGWATHASLGTDGTSVYLAWEEQSALGAHPKAYVKKWDGASWSLLGGALNADPVNGAAQDVSLTVVQGMPTVIWGELTYGSLRQIYIKQWNGSSWTAMTGGATPPSFSPCDVNQDGATNIADVQLDVNATLDVIPCASADDINKDGVCSIVDVQRVVNAALGGSCVSP